MEYARASLNRMSTVMKRQAIHLMSMETRSLDDTLLQTKLMEWISC